ncbi:hypothetical protein KEM55_008103 [Ascosphaera atra]|nr:hypothetical protein KEM55_008103 [Ascosphaera atra]
MTQQGAEANPHYTVFIRLPFERKDFVDPPAVEWNSAKDALLWKVLSRPAGQDIDWETLAKHFKVTVPFLLQQAAWLYDRQLSQVRAQIRRAETASSLRPESSASVTGRDGERLDTSGHAQPKGLSAFKEGGPGPLQTGTASTNPSLDENKENVSIKTPSEALQPTAPKALNHPPPLKTRPSFLDEETDADEEESSGSGRFTRQSRSHGRKSGTFGRFNFLAQSRPNISSHLKDGEEDDNEDDALAFLPLKEDSNKEPQAQRRREPLQPQPETASPGRYADPNATILGIPRHVRDSNSTTAQTTTTSYTTSPTSTTTNSRTNSVGTIPNLSAATSTGSTGAGPSTGLRSPVSGTTDYSNSMSPQNRDRVRVLVRQQREETDSAPSMGSSFSDLDGEWT